MVAVARAVAHPLGERSPGRLPLGLEVAEPVGAHPVTSEGPHEAGGPHEAAAADVRAQIEVLFSLHHAEIHGFLTRMVRDPELAADMTQDTFVKAYRAYDTLEDPERARAWLYQIAHRVALDEFRRRRIVRFLPWTGESHGAAPSAEHLALEGRFSAEMERALLRMPERQRAALILAELHDLTGLELAEALGISHLAARAMLTRARESLRRALAAERAAASAADPERGAR